MSGTILRGDSGLCQQLGPTEIPVFKNRRCCLEISLSYGTPPFWTGKSLQMDHFPKQFVLLPKGMLLACFWQNFRPDHVTKTYRPVGSFHLVHVPTEMFTVFVLLILLQGGAAELCLLVYKPHEYSYIYHKPKNSPSYVHQLNAIIWGPYIVALLLLGRLIANLYQFVKLYFAGVHYLGQTPGWHTQFWYKLQTFLIGTLLEHSFLLILIRNISISFQIMQVHSKKILFIPKNTFSFMFFKCFFTCWFHDLLLSLRKNDLFLFFFFCFFYMFFSCFFLLIFVFFLFLLLLFSIFSFIFFVFFWIF